MKPYYQDDSVTLYLGDSRDVPVWTECDVLVTDPPYGMAYVSNKSKYDGPSKAIHGDNDAGLRDETLSMWAAQKAALVFGTHRVARPDVTLGWDLRQLIVWDKGDMPGMGDLTLPWGPTHEEIYVYGQTGIAKVDGNRVRRGGSVIRANTMPSSDARRPKHPTPKPVALMERLLEGIEAGATVADPFAGSGATLIAARNTGHRSVGVEIDEGYCEMIAKRLSQQAFDFGDLDD